MVKLSDRWFSCYLASRGFKGFRYLHFKVMLSFNKLSIYSLCPFALLFETFFLHSGREMLEAKTQSEALLFPQQQ